MKTYICFLRGINVSGKNIVSMIKLKDLFEKELFTNVLTYKNSGNVIFSSDLEDTYLLSQKINKLIKQGLNLDIPVYVITIEELEDILKHAPIWWDSAVKDIYNNLIFILPPTTFMEVYTEIGQPKVDIEKILDYQNVVFWSFVLKSYSKTNWIKTASSSINNQVTIRTANTVKRILQLALLIDQKNVTLE